MYLIIIEQNCFIGHDINIFLDKGHVYPESTKNGFVSLIAETENAEISASPSKVNNIRYFRALSQYFFCTGQDFASVNLNDVSYSR